MPSKVTKSQKPEDMLIRVIRVAEILVKTQDKASEETAGQRIDQTKVNSIQGQKTQTRDSVVS
jgi:hypothetical protein